MDTTKSFKKIVRGGALFSVGTLTARILQFVTGIVVIRYLTPSEYGLLSLGSVMVAVLVLFSMFGLRTGIPRFLAKYREDGNKGFVNRVAGTALLIAGCMSLLFSGCLFLQAQLLANVFVKPELEGVLKVFALMLPALVMMELFTGIFQGLENVRAKVLFEDIALNAIRLMFVLPILFFSLGFQDLLWAYVAAAWLTFALYMGYAYRNFKGRIRLEVNRVVAKQLILFSLPLLGISAMAHLMTWPGTLTLGYLHTAEEVALFNAPLRLVNVIPIPLMAIIFLYLPLATRLAVAAKFDELQSLYSSGTKWAFLITLPLLLYFIIDAQFIITGLFGQGYEDAADLLRVLALGFGIHTFLGPNGTTLIAFGETWTVFLGALLAGTTALFFCLLLVPHYGALGAAVGTALGKLISNVFVSISLYARFGVHPFSGEYLKPAIFAGCFCFMIGVLLNIGDVSNWLLHVLMLPFFAIVVTLTPLVTRSLTSTDIQLVEALESRLWKRAYVTNWIIAWIRKEKSIVH